MKKIIKEADMGGEDSGSMSPEFVLDRKKKRDSGMTEGEAVLSWLAENEKKNKAKVASSEELKKLSQTFGRPF